MCVFETEHYIFHYEDGSLASQDIVGIAEGQEACYRYISQVLEMVLPYQIHYYLCQTPEEVGAVLGEEESCNGFARMPDTIYAVYNEQVNCLGFHEDAHLISNAFHEPHSTFLKEGLAMYFDQLWWGIDNQSWTLYFYRKGLLPSLTDLAQCSIFETLDCSLTYPVAGCFVQYLMNRFGKERFLTFWKLVEKDVDSASRSVFASSLLELDTAFRQYLDQLYVHPDLVAVMENLYQ